MLSFFPVAEAYGLIYDRSSVENSSFVVIVSLANWLHVLEQLVGGIDKGKWGKL